jgi:hypothetical protein
MSSRPELQIGKLVPNKKEFEFITSIDSIDTDTVDKNTLSKK